MYGSSFNKAVKGVRSGVNVGFSGSTGLVVGSGVGYEVEIADGILFGIYCKYNIDSSG